MTENLTRRVKKAHQPDPLTPLIDRWLIERKDDPEPFIPPPPPPRPPGRFSPSNMNCLRAGVFNFMGVPGRRKITPELQMVFDVGNWLHWMWFSNFLDMQRHFGEEVFKVVDIETDVAVPSLWLAGRFDVHVEIYTKPYIIDVKTINDAGFTTRMHARSADKGHAAQLIRYLRARQVKRGLVFYFNKNDQRFKVYQVTYTKAKWQESVKWLRRGQGYLNQALVPPRHVECEAGNNMARNCPFAYLCYPGRSPDKLQSLVYSNRPTPEEIWERNQS